MAETRSEPTAKKFCSGCGAVIHKEAPACPQCGAPQADVVLREKKSRGLAIVLALFLGGLGIHKFYLGRAGWGILYLVFCWTFVPAIVAFVEAIVYACMSETNFHRKYG
ncbi:MAG: TM2 domain-containing protein [Hyphomicrobiales bacterium]|nr:MAG: TM2 domain-containing protein [Hyphomicrobiales bacterium]